MAPVNAQIKLKFCMLQCLSTKWSVTHSILSNKWPNHVARQQISPSIIYLCYDAEPFTCRGTNTLKWFQKNKATFCGTSCCFHSNSLGWRLMSKILVFVSYCNSFKQGPSVCLTNLFWMFDILTQQEAAKGTIHICQSNCLNIKINQFKSFVQTIQKLC